MQVVSPPFGPRDAVELSGSRPRVLRFRFVILALLALSSAVVAGGRGDWNEFVSAGRQLIRHDGLAFYARHGDIQTGPISLLLAAGLGGTAWRNGFVLGVMVTLVLGLLSVWMIERAPTEPDISVNGRVQTATLIGGMILMFWWAKLGGYGHLDDAIVLTAATGGVVLCRRRMPLVVAALIGLAIATKPWAVIFLPLAIEMGTAGQVVPPSRWSRLRPVVVAVVVGVLAWAPFVLYEPSTLRSLRPTVKVAADSVLSLFGAATEPPGWLRIAQLGLASGVALAAVLRRVPEGVILAAVAVRLVTDPGTWGYYTPALLLGALLWDVARTSWRWPVTTLVMALLLVPDWIVPFDRLRAVMRLAACAGAVITVLTSRPIASGGVGPSQLTTRQEFTASRPDDGR